MKIKYKDGYEYQLVCTFKIQLKLTLPEDVSTRFLGLSKDGLLEMRYGYASDGPSGPTCHSKSFMRGAFVHDALYQLIRMGLIPGSYREIADLELRRICKLDGMCGIRAWWVYQAVKRFGASSASPENVKKIFVAP